MIFVTWSVMNLYGLGSLKVISRELAKYRLDLVEYRSDGIRVALNQQMIYNLLWK